MTRVLSLLFVAAVAVGLALLPEASRAKLATLEAHRLLEIELPDSGGQTLGQLVLAGPAYTADPEQPDSRGTLVLGGVRANPSVFDDKVDFTFHGHVRRSIARGLRELAYKDGIALDIVDDVSPDSKGAAFELTERDGSLVLLYNQPGSLLNVPKIETSLAWSPPSWKALLPPFIAILLAILFRQPIVALLLGVLGGTFLLRRELGGGIGESLGGGALDLVGVYLVNEVKSHDRLLIIGFVVFMLAMVGVITRAGGIRGLMDSIARFAGTVRSTQIATYLMGIAVFFDDYANTILVGSTMRPLTDKFRIAREKLAYIVDSTAAPVAGISIFSTWVAYQVSMYSAQLPAAERLPSEGYAVLLDTLPYRFYCVFALALVGLVVCTGRDFGPMLTAERRARKTGQLVREGGKPMIGEGATGLDAAESVKPKAMTAIVPLAAFVLVTIGTILHRGNGWAAIASGEFFSLQGISNVLSDGSGNITLFNGALAGFLLACAFAIGLGIGRDIPRAAWTTLRSMMIAFLILYLAWMMGEVCKSLGTATYLTALLNESLLPELLPAILFLLSAVVAFSTGSSWSTMAILVPLVVGLSFTLGQDAEIGPYVLMLMSIGCVLEGAIFGDHCSPISDTTVLSSISSASDHIDHVRTQAPYALLAMGVALAVGYLPCAFWNLSPWIALAVGVVVLYVLLLWIGKRTDEETDPAEPQAA